MKKMPSDKQETLQYPTQDVIELDRAGGYFMRHLSAMTGEQLHSKADIAIQLGWRDKQIDDAKAEVTRLKAALSGIHDQLHRDDVNAAHELCECALNGGEATQPSLSKDDSASALTFAVAFNQLCAQHDACAVGVLAVPVQGGVPGQMSLQLFGHVELCRMVEQAIRGTTSTYMGDHGKNEG